MQSGVPSIPRYGLIVLLMLAALLLGAPAQAEAGGEEARRFVDRVGQEVLTVVNSQAPEDQKKAQFRRLFQEHVDIDWMGRFVLGRAWTQASEDQRSRYLAAYREYLLARYTQNFADYTGSNYTITGAKPEAEGQFTVNMQVKSPGAQQQETLAGYRVRPEGGTFKIIDIIIEGVSLITTQRSEFASAYQQGGMDKLISGLQSKTQPNPA